jgi:hypothetical protein
MSMQQILNFQIGGMLALEAAARRGVRDALATAGRCGL